MKKRKQGYFGSNDLLFRLVKFRHRQKLAQSDFNPGAQLFIVACGTAEMLLKPFGVMPHSLHSWIIRAAMASRLFTRPLQVICHYDKSFGVVSRCKSAIAGNSLIDGHFTRSDKISCQPQLYDRIIC